MHLIIRADASPTIGTGHVMRCLALALVARGQGAGVRMVCRLGVPWLKTRLAKENIRVNPLRDILPVKESPEILLQHVCAATEDAGIENCWVVLDGYHFNEHCQRAVRQAGYKLLVIDDYAHLPEYSCDILLNQNIGAEDYVYHGDIGQKLLGLRYVLLRPEFWAARAKAEARILPHTPQNILLTLGGGDFSEHLQRIAPYVKISAMQGRTLRVIAGAMPEEKIRQCLHDCPAQIEVLRNVEDIPALLLDTDLCITAGGSTCWELCCLGVPFLVVEVAENQRSVINELDSLALARLLSGAALESACQGYRVNRDTMFAYIQNRQGIIHFISKK